MAASPDELRAFASQFSEVLPETGRMSSPAPGELQQFATDFAMSLPPEGRAADLKVMFDTYAPDMTYRDEFAAGVAQGTDMLQASLYAMTQALGREMGIDSLYEFGERGLQSNIEEMSKFGPTQARFSEIDTMDDFIRWSAGAFGQALPSLGAAMAGGGIGGAMAKKAVEKSIYQVIRDRMMRQMAKKGFADDVAKEAVERALTSRAGVDMLTRGFQNGNAQLLQRGFAQGATIGAMIPSTAMQAGETEMTLSEAGIDGSLTAIFGAGFAGGALEAIPTLRLIDRMFPGVDKKLAGGFIKDFAKATGSQAALEGSTEGAQELIQLASLAWHDPTFDMNDPDLKLQVLDAFAAGALVGAVTGGGAAGIGRLTQPEDNSFRNLDGQRGRRPGLPDAPIPDIPDATPPNMVFPEDFEPADNTLFEELQGRAQTIIDEKLTPAMNRVSSEFNSAKERVAGSFTAAGMASPYGGLRSYYDKVSEGHAEFVAGHEPITTDTVRYAQEYVMWLADEAMAIGDPAKRQRFIDTKMRELEEEVGAVAAELGQRGDTLIGAIMQDIESDPIMDDMTAPPNPDEVDTEFVFGQMFGFTNEWNQFQRYRTRGQNSRPYPTYEQAADNLESVMEVYPNTPASAWSIREVEASEKYGQPAGFVIAINDSSLRGQLREDEVVSQAIERARLSGRANKDKKRHVQVKFPHKKQGMRIDLPTLVYEGKRLGEGDVQTVRQAFETITGRLWERKMLDEASLETLQVEFENYFTEREKKMTIQQARVDKARAKTLKQKGRKGTGKPGPLTREEAAERQRRIDEGEAEAVEVWIEGADGKRRKVRQTVDLTQDMTKETILGDPALDKPGITSNTGFQTSYRKGVKGSKRVTPRAQGKGEKPFRMVAETKEEGLTEGRAFGGVDPEGRDGTFRDVNTAQEFVETHPDVVAARNELERIQILMAGLTGKDAKNAIASAKRRLTNARKKARLEQKNVQADVRSQGRIARTVDTDPDQDNQAFVGQVEKESKGKLPTEDQQAQQSLLDVGGLSSRANDKRTRKSAARDAESKRTNPLAKNADRLKSVLASFPPPKKRTPEQKKEFAELAWALSLLERKTRPSNAAENNRLKRALDKAGKYTTSGTDPALSGSRAGRKHVGTRSKIAKSDPEGKKVKALKPKPLKFEWVATEGITRGKDDGTKVTLKDKQAEMVRALTNSGLSVQFEGDNKNMTKRIKWIAEKVQKIIPNTRIVILDDATLTQYRDNPTLKEMANHLLKQNDAAMTYLHAMDTVVIRLPVVNESPARALLAVTHELGHAIHFATWKSIGLENQAKLWAAFQADVKAGKRASGETMNKDPNNPWVMGANKSPPLQEANIYEFKEWMADQFQVWMQNRRAPRNALETFFRKLEGELQKFWNLIKGNPGRFGMELNETYAEFADAVVKRSMGVGDPATDQYFTFDKIGLGFEVLRGQANTLDLEFRAAQREQPVVVKKETPAAQEQAQEQAVEKAQEQAKQKTNRAKLGKEKIPGSPHKGLELERWKEMLPKHLTYNEIVRSSKAMRQLMSNLYDVAMAPSVSVMRGLSKNHGIKAADKLANIFHRRPGTTKVNDNYHQQVKRMTHGFMKRYTDIVAGMDEAQKAKFMAELQAGEKPNGMRHRQFRRLMNDMHKYFVDAGLPIGKIENYVPKMLSKQMLRDHEQAILEHYAKKYKAENQSTDKEAWAYARKRFAALMSEEAEQAAAEEQLQQDELSMQSPGFQAMRHRHTQSKFMDQFMETSLDAVVANYVNRGVKRAEYNRQLGSKAKEGLVGGDMLYRNQWNPQEKLEAIMQEARDQGATDIQLMRMKNFVDAQLGMYGRDDVSEGTRKFMAGIIAYQNMRVLLFTVFASLPDMMGPVIRSNSPKTAFVEFSKNIKAIVNGASDAELAQMAEYLGVVTDTMSQHVITEYVDNHYMPPTLRKWNDAFFKYTGLNWYTNATRKYALAVGIKSFENAARDAESARTQRARTKAKKFLNEFGITPKDVREWLAAGKPVYMSGPYASQTGRRGARDDRMSAALVQFVDESIMSPNPAQRPIAASHPGLMLVYHLKGFMFAIYDVFLKRMAYNWQQASTVPEHLLAASPALGMMALTAAGIELRDLITGNDTRGRMDGWEYTWTTIERAGLLGPAQMGWDFQGAGDYGQSEVVALAGPGLSHAGELISKPISQTIPKSIPVISQLPWLRDGLRGATPL